MRANTPMKRNVLLAVMKRCVSRRHADMAASLMATQLQVGHAIMGLECDA